MARRAAPCGVDLPSGPDRAQPWLEQKRCRLPGKHGVRLRRSRRHRLSDHGKRLASRSRENYLCSEEPLEQTIPSVSCFLSFFLSFFSPFISNFISRFLSFFLSFFSPFISNFIYRFLSFFVSICVLLSKLFIYISA